MILMSFRARYTAMGRRLMGEVSLRIFFILGFSWRVAIFFAVVRITELPSSPSAFWYMFYFWYYYMRLGFIRESGAAVKCRTAGGVLLWGFRIFFG